MMDNVPNAAYVCVVVSNISTTDGKIFEITGISTSENSKLIEYRNSEVSLVPLSKYESLKKDINEFVKLKENWDGYGAIPVLPSIAETANTLIDFLGSPFIDGISDIFPNPHGTITIEWQNRNKEKLSLEIGEINYSYFIKYKDENPLLVDGENILSDLKTVTSNLESLFSEEIQKYL
jgi:hypothetical protein